MQIFAKHVLRTAFRYFKYFSTNHFLKQFSVSGHLRNLQLLITHNILAILFLLYLMFTVKYAAKNCNDSSSHLQISFRPYWQWMVLCLKARDYGLCFASHYYRVGDIADTKIFFDKWINKLTTHSVDLLVSYLITLIWI